MTNEELITEARKGCKESEEMLFKNNQKLIYHVINKLNLKYNFEDFIGYGNIGLFNAYRMFDLDKNMKFSTYAYKAIRNEIIKHLEEIYKTIDNEFSMDKLNQKLRWDSDYAESTIMTDYSVQDEFERVEDIDEMQRVVDIFVKKEKPLHVKLLNLLYIKGMTQTDVAKALGVSRQYIYRLKLKIDEKLRHYYEKAM